MSPGNKRTKFQVDSLISSRDIVYTVLKTIFFRKTRLSFSTSFFSEKNYFSFLPLICHSFLIKETQSWCIREVQNSNGKSLCLVRRIGNDLS